MTDEVQNQTAAAAPDQVAADLSAQSAQVVGEVAASSETPTAPVGETSPQPDAAAAPVDAAQAEPEADAEGPAVTSPQFGVCHAHIMVSTWLQRAEAGLHVPLDELRALKERLANWL